MTLFWRVASKSSLPVAAALVSHANRMTLCEAEPVLEKKADSPSIDSNVDSAKSAPVVFTAGMQPDAEGDYHGFFPKRQLWQPKVEYPLWDSNWDGRELPPTGDKEEDRNRARRIRKTGVTRHIILVRHGQYDETHKEDEKRKLTPLGKEQADLTGKRLAEMLKGAEEKFGPCNIKVLRVSGMARAKETAEIIASHLPTVEFAEPDLLLNEGRPSHHIPSGSVTDKIIEVTDANHPRIEEAFQKYFYRAPTPEDQVDPAKDENALVPTESDTTPEVDEKHEFEIIVCHANVIRYFLCRAIQIPPEVWLRMCPFNCSLTYLTIRPTGSVSVRSLGDIGHLSYNTSTFSGHHGFNW